VVSERAPATLSSSLTVAQWVEYVQRLLNAHLPDDTAPGYSLGPVVNEALERTEHCFSHIHRKYYNLDGSIELNHLNSDHMTAVLYLLGNSAWALTGDTVLPTKLFYLNKILNGIDLYFSVPLPEVFLFVHPVGSVVGKAEYGNYLVIYQGCTVGSDDGKYPRFGEGTILYARSCVLGRCEIGADSVFAANSFIIDSDVPAGSLVVGQYPDQRILDNRTSVRSRMFDPVG
jgi:serine O-acetyltransferase